MTVAYRSTGKQIADLPETLSQERIRELRDPTKRSRAAAMEEIVQRREAEVYGPQGEEKFKQAVKHFDTRFADLGKNDPLLWEVGYQMNQRMAEAAVRQEVIDWDQELPEIGERVRRIAGLSSNTDQDPKKEERQEFIRESLASRELNQE